MPLSAAQNETSKFWPSEQPTLLLPWLFPTPCEVNHIFAVAPQTIVKMSSLLQRFYAEIGLKTLISSPPDTKILCLQRLVRLFAYGGSTIILALYLSSLGISDQRIGLFMTLTLLGDVVISLILTVIADGIGRRRMLGLGSLLMTASGIVFATCSNYWALVAASVLGVISPR